MTPSHTNDAVANVLSQMDKHARMSRLAILGAVVIEGLLMAVALYTLDWTNRTHVLMFVFAVLGYTIICLGLVALGAHISKVGMRVVAALDARQV